MTGMRMCGELKTLHNKSKARTKNKMVQQMTGHKRMWYNV